ncbi:GNAT family N-acetyltransferase [Halalkalibacillus sediminis]|uniref:GNAT family N-acetyltransferase n=1 Tax=Halalkalibacillus sediminis TaxID=2018042 RepID=A0A2I0QRX3_9BACI|nr:GNAT family N-acetyltransferase [Halalkalibacillus sediminis]PKR77071.1 GNAT family N-acetyltransferase [Halalkalibacillus sediminis]
MNFVKANEVSEKEYFTYINDWLDYDEKIVPSGLRQIPDDFSEFMKRLIKKEDPSGVKPGWVPSSTYFLLDSGGRILGAANIRHELNEPLLQIGGHVGYGVRPTERGKGYASRMLGESLSILKAMDIERALITCNQDNPASQKVILKNGGKQDESFVEESGNIVERYWIDVL